MTMSADSLKMKPVEPGAKAVDPLRSKTPQADTSNTQRGNTMHVIAFTALMVYFMISAMWLADNGWNAAVGVPFLLVGFGTIIYVMVDYYKWENKR